MTKLINFQICDRFGFGISVGVVDDWDLRFVMCLWRERDGAGRWKRKNDGWRKRKTEGERERDDERIAWRSKCMREREWEVRGSRITRGEEIIPTVFYSVCWVNITHPAHSSPKYPLSAKLSWHENIKLKDRVHVGERMRSSRITRGRGKK